MWLMSLMSVFCVFTRLGGSPASEKAGGSVPQLLTPSPEPMLQRLSSDSKVSSPRSVSPSGREGMWWFVHKVARRSSFLLSQAPRR